MATVQVLVLMAGLSVAASAQTRWTVDDDGPADFASLTAAVGSPLVQPHDVLLVAPGTYSPFKTSKTLRIVARGGERPEIVGGETIVVPAAGPVVFAGLRIQELQIAFVNAPVVVEDCEIGHIENQPKGSSFESAYNTFELESCDAVVSGTTALGQQSAFNGTIATPALGARNGHFAVVNCDLSGGPGGLTAGCSSPGRAAIRFENAGTLVVAGSRLQGGQGGSVTFPCSQNNSAGGPGLNVMAESLGFTGPSWSWIRGSQWHEVDAGEGTGSGPDAASVQGTGGAVRVSGASFELPLFGGSVTGSQLEFAEPYLAVEHDGVPGGLARLLLSGPVGQDALVCVAMSGAPSEPAHVSGGPLWLVPSSVIASFHVATLGQQTPAIRSFRLPEGQEPAGTVLWLQAFFLQPDGSYFATNPATVVLRF